MGIFISTTGTMSTVKIDDLNGRKLIHPVVNLDLLDEFDLAEISASYDGGGDLSNLVTNGYIIITTDASIAGESANIQQIGDYVVSTKSNTDIIDPTINDDKTIGYTRNSVWLNTITNNFFICRDSASGAAVWDMFSSSNAGTLPITFNFFCVESDDDD